MISGVARNQQKRGATFSHERGAIDVTMSIGAPVWLYLPPSRERGKRGAFEAFRSVSDAYDLWGRPCAKEGRIMKVMGRLHRRIVELHCVIRVIRKVMVLR